MLTPVDIEEKVFGKAVRGYNCFEVDKFLDEIIVDYQKVIAERNQLKEELSRVNDQIKEHKASEASVINTLESAKKLMKDISESAERRAEIILQNANVDAKVIIKDAEDKLEKLTNQCNLLEHKLATLKSNYRNMLLSELSKLDSMDSPEYEFSEEDNEEITIDIFKDVEDTNVEESRENSAEEEAKADAENEGAPEAATKEEDYEPLSFEDLDLQLSNFIEKDEAEADDGNGPLSLDDISWNDEKVEEKAKKHSFTPKATVVLDKFNRDELLVNKGKEPHKAEGEDAE